MAEHTRGRSSTDSELLPLHAFAAKTNDSLPPARIEDFDASAVRDIIKDLMEYYGVTVAFLALESPKDLKLKARYGVSPTSVGHDSIAKHGIARDLPIIIENTGAKKQFLEDPLVVGPPALGFFAGSPLMMSPRQCVGSLCIMDVDSRDFSLNDAVFLQRCARKICQIYKQVFEEKEIWTLTVSSLVSLEGSDSRDDEEGEVGPTTTSGSLPLPLEGVVEEEAEERTSTE